ncbi:hypothetical protein DYB31_006610 [Aphanomyces astaci]|uniref:Uncharacterized protein n=1 Tax=Aphanomyces astaci TaxID=112090 RepID=A0A397EJR3_APHAT|nr:hypothetical protein DYB31_006610 [Aphanomyces astaci]
MSRPGWGQAATGKHGRFPRNLRREFRSQEKAHAAAEEGCRKEMDMLRTDHMEAMALNEELQAKISTIQSAANATINDLVAELTHAEDLLKADQARRAQDDELLRSQYVEDDLKRKEVEWKEATMMLKRELAVRRDNYDSLETKYQKQKEMLEAKKVEVDKLTKDNEHRQLKLAELERKLAPLANIKETTATRLSEMKLVCDAKLKESHDLEEKLRDDLVRLQKEKRDLESSHLRAKDELDHSASGRYTLVHQQLTSENKLLKSTLDRTKLELHHATDNVATLAQRLDAQQNASNATIADLSGRLQGLDQQYQAALASLWGCMSRLSTPSLVELSHRMESALSQRSSSHDEASGKLKAKTYSKSTTTKDTLKLIKKKIKQDDNKLKATASLPKLV